MDLKNCKIYLVTDEKACNGKDFYRCIEEAIKGGHLSNSAVDILINREEIHILEGEKILSNNTHGTGCSLSSAIASNLAKSYSMLDSVKKAKNFVLCSIKNSIDFGEIGETVNQMGEIYKNIDIEKLY